MTKETTDDMMIVLAPETDHLKGRIMVLEAVIATLAAQADHQVEFDKFASRESNTDINAGFASEVEHLKELTARARSRSQR